MDFDALGDFGADLELMFFGKFYGATLGGIFFVLCMGPLLSVHL